MGYTRTCTECNATFGAVPDTYRGIATGLQSPDSLLTETFPNYYEAYSAQIALERKTPSQLTSEERRFRLESPFLVAAEVAQQRLSHIKMDRGSWYAVGGFLLIYLGSGFLLRTAPVDIGNQPAWSVIPMLAAFAVLLIGLGSSGRRYAVSWALPILARAVGPLRPTEAELDDVLTELRNRNLKLGSRLRVADLQRAIEGVGSRA